MKRIGITTDCVCDMPKDMLEELGVEVVYFYIDTDTGRFRDTDEVNSAEILDYMHDEDVRVQSVAPPPEEYMVFFRKKLESCDEVIHIAISSGISQSCQNASQAIAQMEEEGKRIHLIDSAHLSSGMGFMVLQADAMKENGCSAEQIIQELEGMKKRLSVSFITRNIDYLYRGGKVGKNVMRICRAFSLHPVLAMKKGMLSVKSIYVGDYERAVNRYIKKELRHQEAVDDGRVFITHAGCRIKLIRQAAEQVDRCMHFEKVVVNSASATVTSNCGPDSLGVLFLRKV